MRALAVVAGGVLYALALPPFAWAWCAWFVLVPLLWAVRGQSTRVAFRYGVLLGYSSGWAVTWCFADAATRYFEMPLPIAVAAVALWYLVVCGVPFGLFAAGSALVLRRRRPGEALVLVPALWVASEYLRGAVMEQPWGLLGYTQHAHQGLIQIAALTGVYGVSFLVALGSTAIAVAATGSRQARIPLVAAGTVIACCWIAGALSLPSGPAVEPAMRAVAIVQTNVQPTLHWTRAYTDAQVAAHVRATETLPSRDLGLIVWPENSVPRYLEQEPMLAMTLAGVARRHHADLLIGGPRYEDGRTYNAARLLTATGRNGGHYDKRRLVLFAEEKPMRFAETDGPNESPEQFTPGSGSGVLRSFVPIGVSICHEIVHPDLARASVRDGAELLVNIANDGWLDGGYGFAGPQHLAMAVFRAIETRRFLVRAATTGTSAVIDPYGTIVAAQPPQTAGLVTAAVAGRKGLTPYVQLGDCFALLCTAVAASWLLARLLPRLRRRASVPLLPVTS